MKLSLIVAAVLMLVFASGFALAKMDILDADNLRFLPELAGAIVAVGMLYRALQKTSKSPGRATTRQKKGAK